MSLDSFFAVVTTFIMGLFPHTTDISPINPTSYVLGAAITPTATPSATISPKPTIYNKHSITATPTTPVQANNNHTQVTKIGDHTYTLQLTADDRMATPEEILAALNNYRRRHGIGTLTWNDKLSAFAQSRADFFNQQKKLDDHAGFTQLINQEDGFNKLGFNHLGENSAYAGPLNAAHLVEQVFGADAEHDNNQLNGAWSFAGVGVSGIATDIVFASDSH